MSWLSLRIGKEESLILLDPLSLLCILTGIFISVYLFISPNPPIQLIQISMLFVIGLVGVLMNLTLFQKRDPLDINISPTEAASILMTFTITIGAILLVNMAIFLFSGAIRYQTITFNTKLMAILAAIAEELMFRGFILALFYSITRGNSFVAITTSSALWAIYHSWVYQSFSLLLIVFFAGVILSYAYIKSKGRLSGTILAHMLINWVSG